MQGIWHVRRSLEIGKFIIFNEMEKQTECFRWKCIANAANLGKLKSSVLFWIHHASEPLHVRLIFLYFIRMPHSAHWRCDFFRGSHTPASVSQLRGVSLQLIMFDHTRHVSKMQSSFWYVRIFTATKSHIAKSFASTLTHATIDWTTVMDYHKFHVSLHHSAILLWQSEKYDTFGQTYTSALLSLAVILQFRCSHIAVECAVPTCRRKINRHIWFQTIIRTSRK